MVAHDKHLGTSLTFSHAFTMPGTVPTACPRCRLLDLTELTVWLELPRGRQDGGCDSPGGRMVRENLADELRSERGGRGRM